MLTLEAFTLGTQTGAKRAFPDVSVMNVFLTSFMK